MELNEETIKLDNLLRNINMVLSKYTKNKLTNYDLTLQRFHTLWLISKLEPVNMSNLNEKMMVARSTLTVLVDHLVEEDFVERYRDDEDRRVVMLKTTTKGKKQLKALLDERQKFFQKALIDLGLNEQKQTINLLELILSNLKGLYMEYGKEDVMCQN